MVFPPISLAALRYDQRAFEKFFTSASVRKHKLYDQQEVYSANIYLKPELVPAWKKHNYLYSNCDGSGTAFYRNDAMYKGISEAFERLAFYRNFQSRNYGFDLDCSTNGMAAFPGLTQSTVRNIAYSEAVERWCLGAFWRGELTITRTKKSGALSEIFFRTPFSGYVFLISYVDFCIESGPPHGKNFRAYGFAAGKKIKSVQFRAMVELTRNIEVLESKNKDLSKSPLGLIEKRLYFFSTSDGSRLFDERVQINQRNQNLLARRPSIMIDTCLIGEWSPYCKIHRVLFEGMLVETDHPDEFSF